MRMYMFARVSLCERVYVGVHVYVCARACVCARVYVCAREPIALVFAERIYPDINSGCQHGQSWRFIVQQHHYNMVMI